MDFVHLAQLPRADSFSSHDDSLEEDSLEKEIFAALRKKRLVGEERKPPRDGRAKSAAPKAVEPAVAKATGRPEEKETKADLSLELGSVPLPEECLVAQLSPVTAGSEDALLGGLVGIPPPPEYRSNAVNEVLRKYEELERKLALELSRLGCPPPPVLTQPPSVAPPTSAPGEALLARPEDISDSSSGLNGSDASGGEDALRLDSDDTLGESPERTFSEEEETALVGDEPTLCSSPFSSSVPDTPEAQYPSFVDLDVIVGSGLLEPSSSSSSMLSSYSKNGHPLDCNPFLQ